MQVRREPTTQPHPTGESALLRLAAKAPSRLHRISVDGIRVSHPKLSFSIYNYNPPPHNGWHFPDPSSSSAGRYATPTSPATQKGKAGSVQAHPTRTLACGQHTRTQRKL